MNIQIIAVVSANGKLTRRDESDIYKWTSSEDQKFFFSEIAHAKIIVMGSGTYNAIKNNFKLDEEDRLRIVLTSNPDQYKDSEIKGKIEFSSESPAELVGRLENSYNEILLAGGARVYSSFMKAGLVDEIYLTIEPIVFGEGKNLFEGEDFEADLELISQEKLNDRGTLLLKYKVNK